MADLASTDVTLTIQKLRRTARARTNSVKIAFGNGTLTYPLAGGGVPLPASPLLWGLRLSIEDIVLADANDGSGILWKYDRENHKLRGYISGVTVAAAGSATMDDFALDTSAEPLATAVAVSLTNSTGAGVKYLGSLVELAAAAAPAAQVLYAIVYGR